jgi:hypothetical protein
MSIAPPGHETAQASPPPPPPAPQEAPLGHKDAKAQAAAAKAYAKAQRPWWQRKRVIIPVGFVVLAAAASVGTSGGGSGPNSDANGGNPSQTFSPSEGDGADDSPSEDGPTFENGVLTTPDLKIQITRYKVINAGQKGNEYGEKPVIAFWYKTTNLSGAKVDPMDFLFNFNAYQDNNPNAENELDVGSAPDDRFLDSQTENIKKGGTVENAAAYELDDLATPVNLVATEGLLGDVIGKATYKLK